MSGTWPTARAAIKAQLNGVTWDLGASYDTATLTAFEYAVPGRQDAVNWPYAFVMPAEQRVRREPGGQRLTDIDAVVRVMLAPKGQSESMEYLQTQYDAAVEALKDALDDGVALDGTADIFLEQVFGGLVMYVPGDLDEGWGFEMTLAGIQISETKTFGV